jgi:hypothetical protein
VHPSLPPCGEQFSSSPLRKAIAYEKPKLTAVATLDGKSFADLLDKAIERQERTKQPPKMIDVTHLTSELKGPMARLRRRI